jgi:hypothetical protein
MLTMRAGRALAITPAAVAFAAACADETDDDFMSVERIEAQ